MGGYSSKELASSPSPGAAVCDDSSVETFNFPGGSPNAFGRCFIEVGGVSADGDPSELEDDSRSECLFLKFCRWRMD